MNGFGSKDNNQASEAGNGRVRGRSKSVAGRERSESVDDRGRRRSQSIVSVSRGRSKTPAPVSDEREKTPAANGRGRAKTPVALSRTPTPSEQVDERRKTPAPTTNGRAKTPSSGSSVKNSMRARVKTLVAEPQTRSTPLVQAQPSSHAQHQSEINVPPEKGPQTNDSSQQDESDQTIQAQVVKTAQKEVEVSEMDVEGDTLVEAEVDIGQDGGMLF